MKYPSAGYKYRLFAQVAVLKLVNFYIKLKNIQILINSNNYAIMFKNAINSGKT